MSLYNTLTGNTLKPGDIVAMSPNNATDKFALLKANKQTFDESFAPKLYGLSNYQGNSGVTDLTFNDINTVTEFNSATDIIIKRNNNESYIIGTSDGGFRGIIARIDNNNIQNPVILKQNFVTGDSFKFFKFMACIVNDKIHICYSSSTTAYYTVYDIINDTLSLEKTITSSLDPVCIRYIESQNKILIVLRTSSNNLRLYSTVNGDIFTLENSYSVDSRYIDDYVNNYYYSTNGTNNFYNDKLWFCHLDQNFIFSINVNDYSYINEFDISTLSINSSNSQAPHDTLFVTEDGVFMFIHNYNDSTGIAEIFYCEGDFSNAQINTQSYNGSSPSLNLIDSNSAIFKNFDSGDNILSSSFNLSNKTNQFSLLYQYSSTLNSNKSSNISLIKDANKLIISTSDSRSASASPVYIEFDATVSKAPLVLPFQPTLATTQYSWYVYKG